MNTLDIIRNLSKDKGISIKTLEKELGYGNGSLAKANVIPSDRILQLSKFFGVSMEYLMGDEEAVKLSSKDERDIKKDIDRIMEKLISKEEGPASYDGEDIDPEAAELFRDELEIALRRLKIINKEKYTPKKYKK